MRRGSAQPASLPPAAASQPGSAEVGGHRAAKRALELIEQVAASSEPTALSELARRLGMPKSSAHALARTLGDEGYLARDPRGAYMLGPRLLSLLGRLPSQYELPRLARPIMRELVDDIAETALLGVRQGTAMVYVEQVEASQFIRYVAPLGEPRPLYCTSIGKLYLASLPVAEAKKTLKSLRLDALTDQTKVDIAAILAELDAVRVQGFALNCEESVVGVTGLAVPIHEGGRSDGALIAGLCAVGPSERMRSRLAGLPERLANAAARVGAGIKFR